MQYSNTIALLNKYRNEPQLSLEAIMALVRTFFLDVQYQTGELVEDCPIGDMKQLVANLSAVTNDIVFVFRNHEDAILESQETYLSSLRKAQSSCGSFADRLNTLLEQIRAEEARQTGLEAQLQQEQSYAQQLEALRARSAQLQAQVDALGPEDPESETGRLKAQILAREQTLESLLQAQQEARQQLEQLQLQETDCRQELTRLDVRIDEKAAQVHSLRSRTEARQATLEEMLRKEQSCTQQLAALQQRAQELQAQLDTLRAEDPESETGKLHARILAQEQTLDGLLQAQHDAQDRLSLLQQQEADCRQALTGLDSQMEDKTAQVQSLNARIETRQAELEQMLSKEQSCTRQLAELQQRSQALQTQLDALRPENPESEAGKLRARILIQEQELVRKEEEQQLSQSRLTALQEQLEQRENQLIALTSQVQSQTAELSGLTAQLASREEQLTALKDEQEARKKDILAAETALEQEKTASDTMMAQLVELNTALSAKAEDNRLFRENHLDTVRLQLSQLEAEAAADRQQNRDLKQTLEQQQTERKTIANENVLLKLKAGSTEKLLEEERSRYNQIRQQLDDMEEELREKAAASEALLNREKELRELLDERNISRIRREVEAGIRKLEADVAQARKDEEEAKRLRQKLDEASQQLAVNSALVSQYRQEQQDLQTEHDTLQAQLDALTSETANRRCSLLKNRMDTMRVLIRQLQSSIPYSCGREFALEQEMTQGMDYAENLLQCIQKFIRGYADYRQQSLEAEE